MHTSWHEDKLIYTVLIKTIQFLNRLQQIFTFFLYPKQFVPVNRLKYGQIFPYDKTVTALNIRANFSAERQTGVEGNSKPLLYMKGKSLAALQVSEILKNVSRMDQSGIKLPETDSTGELIQYLYEVASGLYAENKQLKEHNKDNELRIKDILDILLQYNRTRTAPKATLSEKKDEVDAIAAGLNILVEELESSGKAEKAYIKRLEKSEERYKLLVEGVKDYAIFMLDIQGNIISWNQGAEQIKGYSAEEILGKHFSIFFTREELENSAPETYLEMAIQKGRFEKDVLRVKKDGTPFWANIVLTALYDDYGNLYGFSKITRNIHERKIAEERISQLHKDLEQNIQQLEEVNKELEAFSYSVSHDLRAPLRAIHGYTNILFEDFFKEPHPEARRLMSLITYNAERMGRLVDDLLSFSQLGRKSIKIRTVNTNTLVENVLLDFKNSDNQLKCTFNVLPLHNAKGDYTLLSQVFYNLISNAIKYSSPNPKAVVEIGSEVKGNNIIFYVKDNGVGFDMKYYHKLFGVFQRLHKAREFEGTGVGLALVQRIVTKHGGSVWAEAKVGEGATFYFTLGSEG